MALRSWLKTLSDSLFKKDISREGVVTPGNFDRGPQQPFDLLVETPQRYLEIARKCTEHVKRMTSPSASTPVQFNHGQCAHLALKVEVVVRSAEDRSPVLCSPEVTASFVGITKLLWRCAKEVEAFIMSCRQDKWVQAAVVLWNASEYVSSLSLDLDFCMILLKHLFAKVSTRQEMASELAEVEDLDQSKSVDEVVESDQRALLRRLEAMNYKSKNSNDEELELAKYLSRRLTQHLNSSGIVESKVWEVEYSSLRQMQMLGIGWVGTVRKSTWLGVDVAEKMIHPSFRNEVVIDILAGLVHPNIVHFLGYAMDKRRCSFVMELMDGDLYFLMEERLRRNPGLRFPFTTSEAVDLMLQTAEGMRYIHANKVVHSDLKSLQILVKKRIDSDGEYIDAKVNLSGLSRREEQSSSYEPLTLNTGTTRWMAPELIAPREHIPQANPELPWYPFKVDVFSFGMVCYEILTGKVPFSTIYSPIEVRRMVLDGIRPELPDEYIPDLKSLIHSCWESDPRDRPSFVEICKRLRGLKYLLMTGMDLETIHDYSEVTKVQDELPIKENPSDGKFVEEDLFASRIKVLEEMTSDGELVKEEPLTTRMRGISEMLPLQKQDVSGQFMKILQDVYEPKSMEEFQDILENEISRLSYLLELRTKDGQEQNLSEYDETMIIFHFTEKKEEDHMFEFFFRNYEGMACIIDVGLENAKVILEDGWQVKVVEISKEDYDNVWENFDSTSRSLMFTIPQSFIPSGRFLLLDIAYYFILKETYALFPSSIVSYSTSHSGGASSSSSSMNQNIPSFGIIGLWKTVQNIIYRNGASRELGTKNDVGSSGNDPDDTPNKDSEFIVTLELLRGGNVDGDGDGSEVTALMKEQLQETIWTRMKFKFIDDEVGGKKIQVSVGPTTFAFNEENGENVKQRGLFGWYHRFLDIKFAPKNKEHAKIDSGFKPRSLDITEGKVSDKTISSMEGWNHRTIEAGASASAMVHAGIANAGIVVPALKYSNTKGSKTTRAVEDTREHVIGYTDDEFSFNGTVYADNEKVHYMYESLAKPDLNPPELRNQGDYDDHWRHEYTSPFCRAQRVGFEAAWTLHNSPEENYAHVQGYPFVEYVFEASRQVEFETVLQGPAKKGKGKQLRDNGSKEERFEQHYEKCIWLNHGMSNVVHDLRSFDVFEDRTLGTLLRDRKTRRAPKWGNPGPLALGSAVERELRHNLFQS